ncbi:zinc-binding dehydrogenase [Actinomadura nitritigenes]|uniref:Zinc-binding alcohol dehydrogenase family protein n=1 Tax=Actinomadura nitritigenes TaxID=134602 RepID=A0ABS3RE76_9ACTN|nr:zinc-binding alcohol dehydrogenase family protein [Actinomadura nitritigenes]MBO2444481.1 zinc-binding alcohol dehydrogenase family protein [Actinomadura nitritigenes]
MQAVVLDTDDQFHLTDIDEPTPGPGQVAIRVAYAGIQYGDVLVRNGHFPVPRPFVPGFEAAGHIVAVGDGIDPARIGTPVTALTSAGAYAEVVIAPAVLTLEATGLDPRVAAGFGWVTPTAFDLINTVTRVRPGDSVLIHAAAGGVGTLAAQFAKAAGAATIVGVVGNHDQAGYAAPFGYDRVLVREQFPDALADDHFDVILDPIGGPTRHANLERLAPHGRLAVYGNIATFEPVEVSANDLLMNGKSLLTYNSNLLSETHPERLAASAQQALKLLTDGQVRIDITAQYEPAELDTAIQRLADGATRGKSILQIA